MRGTRNPRSPQRTSERDGPLPPVSRISSTRVRDNDKRDRDEHPATKTTNDGRLEPMLDEPADMEHNDVTDKSNGPGLSTQDLLDAEPAATTSRRKSRRRTKSVTSPS